MQSVWENRDYIFEIMSFAGVTYSVLAKHKFAVHNKNHYYLEAQNSFLGVFNLK
jgi:hypothetical protein